MARGLLLEKTTEDVSDDEAEDQGAPQAASEPMMPSLTGFNPVQGSKKFRAKALTSFRGPSWPLPGRIRWSYTLSVPILSELFSGVSGFQWDAGNSDKSWRRHGVSQGEAEQVFFNRPIVVANDPKHSQPEPRYFALGRTDAERRLLVVFMLRGSLLRVISARPMSRPERRIYGEATGL